MRKLIIILFAFSLFTSCNKDKDKTCALSVTAVAGNYKITAIRYKATPTSAETDYFNTFFPDACKRDDVISFNANGTYIFTDVGVRCTPPGDDSGIWTLTNNVLTIDGSAANVDAFSCSGMTVSRSDVIDPGDKLIFVFTKQ